MRLWFMALLEPNIIPWGSIIPGMTGDLNRLHLDFGWSINQILVIYALSTILCIITVLIFYGKNLKNIIPYSRTYTK